MAEEAIQHRILAVKSLNEALSVPPKNKLELDARMAAALALTFQSSHLQDGLFEFLTMVRGCNLIAGDEALGNVDSAFHVCHQSFPIRFFSCWSSILTYIYRPSAKMDT